MFERVVKYLVVASGSNKVYSLRADVCAEWICDHVYGREPCVVEVRDGKVSVGQIASRLQAVKPFKGKPAELAANVASCEGEPGNLCIVCSRS